MCTILWLFTHIFKRLYVISRMVLCQKIWSLISYLWYDKSRWYMSTAYPIFKWIFFLQLHNTYNIVIYWCVASHQIWFTTSHMSIYFYYLIYTRNKHSTYWTLFALKSRYWVSWHIFLVNIQFLFECIILIHVWY